MASQQSIQGRVQALVADLLAEELEGGRGADRRH
jgi:hypothetical protein